MDIKKLLKMFRPLDALLAAIIFTAIAATGWLDIHDLKLSDKFYQKISTRNDDIVVVGVDSNTLNRLGAITSWIRRDMAKVIEYLNCNPESRPAAIGLDFIFSGDNPDAPELDRQLVETVAKYDNVVIASAAVVDEDEESNDPYAPWNRILPWDTSFTALANVADTGHIFEPHDKDGIIRHQLLYIDVIERGRIFSFARVLYEKSCQAKGIVPNPPPLTIGNGLYYLPFTAKSYSDDINFADLVEGKVPADIFRDKVVLIGVRAPGMGDEFLTSLDSSSPIYGVDIHANSIQAFQKNFFPRELDESIQLAILFAIIFCTELLFRNGKMSHVVAEFLLICLVWLGICHVCYRHEIILHVLRVPLFVSILFVGIIATNYVFARAEKERVTETFGRYVDPTIMRQLLQDNSTTETGGTLRNIAVLFVDIRGFTTMSEELPPTTVVEILNRYLTLTSDCIRRHHGTLDKFVGDCTMAFWNAPLPQEEPVLLACRAAVDMLEGSKDLRAELKQRYGREITFGVGVHWGSAVVGNIGSPFRMDYTAIGDTVNTAARLEANAPGGKIFISRAVADILGARADVTSLGDTVKLKGKAAGFEVLMLNSLHETED